MFRLLQIPNEALRSSSLLVILSSLSALLFASPTAVQSGLIDSTPAMLGQHRVQPGDTIYCLGRAYGVYPRAIAQANNLSPLALLSPGQILNIPAVPWANISPGPVCEAQFKSPYLGQVTTTPIATATASELTLGVHVVQRGETIYCIGRAYAVRPTAITRANFLVAPFRLYPGQALTIPAVLWALIPAGPICQAQFASPFVNTTVTPPSSLSGATLTFTPTFTPTRGGPTKTPLPTRTEPPKP